MDEVSRRRRLDVRRRRTASTVSRPVAEANGLTPIFLDGPGGTQVPRRVIDAIGRLPDDLQRQPRRRLHHQPRIRRDPRTRPTRPSPTCSTRRSPDEIVFGQNMTTLTLHLSRSLGQDAGSRRRGDGDAARPRRQRHARGCWPPATPARRSAGRHPSRGLHARPRRPCAAS